MKAFMFVFAALLVIGMTSVTSAQELHNSEIGISVDVSGTPLDIQPSLDLTVVGITAGTAIALVPDGADAFLDGANLPNPVYSNVVSNSAAGAVDVSGQENATVIISFALPYALYGDGSFNGTVRVDYNGTSACWVDDQGTVMYFNPKNPETMILSSTTNQATHVNLGGIFTVEPASAAGVYTGTAIVTVAYAAN